MPITDLRFEHHRIAIGIGERRPRLSWRYLDGDVPEIVEVRSVDPETGLVETASLDGSESVLAAWPFAELGSRARRDVSVRSGSDEWGAPAIVEAGFFEASDWQARMIAPQTDEGSGGAVQVVRSRFSLAAPVVRARLYATSWGMHVAELNGQRVSDERFAPGWTSYLHRLRYRTHDVTALLTEGDNEWSATLADGWFRGRIGWEGGITDVYGDRTGYFAQLEIELADGSRTVLKTDDSWQSTRSDLTSSNIYDGEHRDSRVRAGERWLGVDVLPFDAAVLVAAEGPPVRPTEVLPVVATEAVDDVTTRYDFGQNLVGVLRVTLSGPAGSVVTARHAEVLELGELGVRPLRLAKATDSIVLDGSELTWQPEFTFHGFRYAELAVSDRGVRITSVEAVVLHTDMERTGWFESSDTELNRLFENVVWGMRGNFVDVPTDCPQRDERLGWTGDIAVFAPTATGLFDCSGVLSSWLRDLSFEQVDNGGIPPLVVPTILATDTANAIWGDAAVAVPWALYERYGDSAVLERSWPSMTAWLDIVRSRAGERLIWDSDVQLGDWLDPSAPPDNPFAAKTDGALVATAWFAHSASLVARAADVLGRTTDATQYRTLAANVKAAFIREYMSSAGRLSSDSQTAYALAIVFELYPDAATRNLGATRLAELVESGGFRIGTGFAGTPVIADALTIGGYPQVAYRMLAERECPSFRYPVTMGATTVWERWDSMLPDGSINPGDMTSFNHYALGAVADWMQRTIGGIAPLDPAYRRIAVAPIPGGDLTFASTRILTPYGIASSSWTSGRGRFELEVAIPIGSTALVTLPNGAVHEVTAGDHRFEIDFEPAYPPTPLIARVFPAVSLARQLAALG